MTGRRNINLEFQFDVCHLKYCEFMYLFTEGTILSILDFCSTINCLNGAVCVEEGDGPKCVCLRGFKGDKCDGNE